MKTPAELYEAANHAAAEAIRAMQSAALAKLDAERWCGSGLASVRRQDAIALRAIARDRRAEAKALRALARYNLQPWGAR